MGRKMVEKFLLICSCRGQEKKAIQSFNVLFPGEKAPPVVKGRDRMMKFALERKNDHLKALAKLSGRYSYYVELDGDKIVKEINLDNGKRIA